jgi:hypothetical protein
VKLEKLVFKTESGKKIELTSEESKQLFNQLSDIYGSKWPYWPYDNVFCKPKIQTWEMPPYISSTFYKNTNPYDVERVK